jgi:hypothetical protein
MGTDEKPGQEDFGWYLNFEAAGIGHTFVIGTSPKWRNGNRHLERMA